MVTGSDLLSISPDLAKRLHDGTTVRRVMFRDPLADESATVDKMIAGIRSETTGAVTTAYLEELPGTSDSEEEEEIEVKEKTLEKETLLTALLVEAKQATKVNGRWRTTLEIQFLVSSDGAVEVTAWEVGTTGAGEKVTATVAAQ